MGSNLNPTLNIVEGYFERDEGCLEWDVSDLREIPEEWEDWDDVWSSPRGCSDRDGLFSTPNYEHYSDDDDSRGNESDPEEYLEELQAVLRRTPYRYQSTWIPGNSPREELQIQKKRKKATITTRVSRDPLERRQQGVPND